MESQLLTSSLLRRNSSASVARINMSAHSAGSENGIKIGWAACLESGQSSWPAVCHQTLAELRVGFVICQVLWLCVYAPKAEPPMKHI